MPRISALTALASADSGDTLPILDVSATTTKKITKTAFLSDVVNGTLIAAQAITPTKVDLSVADDAARTALTGFEGLTVYQEDTDANYIYDGSVWRRQAQWEELGRTTLGTAGDTISINPIAARKYLQVWYHVWYKTNTINPQMRFNNDSGTNYACVYSTGFGAAANLTSQTYAPVAPNTAITTQQGLFFITNNAAQRKLYQGSSLDDNNASATTTCNSVEFKGKWANTADQITRIDLINAGAGDFEVGSEMIVLGKN